MVSSSRPPNHAGGLLAIGPCLTGPRSISARRMPCDLLRPCPLHLLSTLPKVSPQSRLSFLPSHHRRPITAIAASPLSSPSRLPLSRGLPPKRPKPQRFVTSRVMWEAKWHCRAGSPGLSVPLHARRRRGRGALCDAYATRSVCRFTVARRARCRLVSPNRPWAAMCELLYRCEFVTSE